MKSDMVTDSGTSRVKRVSIGEPVHVADLWNPGSPREPGRYELDGVCLVCGALVPNTVNTWTPVGLMCISDLLDRLTKRKWWRQRARRRAEGVFRGLVGGSK